MNGILIEYEGEDSGIGLLFASKAAVQVLMVMVAVMLMVLQHMLMVVMVLIGDGADGGHIVRSVG